MKKWLLTALAFLGLSALVPAHAATTYFNLFTPTVGASTNIWGTQLNTIFNTLDTDLWTVGGGFTQGVNNQSSASNITLSAPMKNVQAISFGATSKNLILPSMNGTFSPVVGSNLVIYNAGINPFTIMAQDGSTPIITNLLTGQFVNLYLTNAGTANGSFIVSGPYGAAGVGAGNFTTLSATGAAQLNSTLAVTGTSNLTGAVTLGSTINKLTLTPPATGATLTIANGKTLTANNTLTFAGSDNTAFTFPATSDTVVTLGATQTLTNKTLTSPTLNSPILNSIASTSTATTQPTGTSDNTLATTAFVNAAGACSLAGVGYCKLPSGLIIQWGSVNVSNGNYNFATTFPNVCLTVVGNIANTQNTSGWITGIGCASASQWGVFTANLGGSYNYNYVAIGF